MANRKEMLTLRAAYLNEISPNSFLSEFCVSIGENLPPPTKDYFDLVGHEIFIHMDKTRSMANVIAKCGLTKSVGEAKRQGWNFEIPEGMSNWEVKDQWRKVWVCVYKEVNDGK